MDYEGLLLESDKLDLIIKEKDLVSSDGRILDKRIAIRRNMESCKKNCVLAEELGHYHTSVGNIIKKNDYSSIKQERIARQWAYDKLITIDKLISAFEYGCRNKYELAEYLNVTEPFLDDALNYFKRKYGMYIQYQNYVVYFIPSFAMLKIFEGSDINAKD